MVPIEGRSRGLRGRSCQRWPKRRGEGPFMSASAVAASRNAGAEDRCGSELRLPGTPPPRGKYPQLLPDQRNAAHGAKVPCVDGSTLARTFCTSQVWSEQPCVRPVDAVHMTAGHNALRGSGPGQKPAFDDAVAHVGCPDLRIDRICITCCSSFQPSHHADDRRDLLYC